MLKAGDPCWYFPAKDDEIYSNGKPLDASVNAVNGPTFDVLVGKAKASPADPNPWIRRGVTGKASAGKRPHANNPAETIDNHYITAVGG